MQISHVKSYSRALQPVDKLPSTVLTLIAEYGNSRDYEKLASIFDTFKNIDVSILYQSHFPCSFKEITQLIDFKPKIQQVSFLNRVGQVFCKVPSPTVSEIKGQLYSARKVAQKDPRNFVSVKHEDFLPAYLSELTDGRLAWVLGNRNIALVDELGVRSEINTGMMIGDLLALQNGSFAAFNHPNIFICDPDSQALSLFATAGDEHLWLIGFQDGSIGAYGYFNLSIWNSDGQQTMDYAGRFERRQITELPDGNIVYSKKDKISMVSRQGTEIGEKIIFPNREISSLTALRDGSLAISMWDKNFTTCTLYVRSTGGDMSECYRSNLRIDELLELNDGCLAFILKSQERDNVITIMSRGGNHTAHQLKGVYEDAHSVLQRRNGGLACIGRRGVFLGDVNPNAILDLATKQARRRWCAINKGRYLALSVMVLALSLLYRRAILSP